MAVSGAAWRPQRYAEGHPSTRHPRVKRSLDNIGKTVVAIGSHDLALDLLSNALARRAPGASLASANVGSLGQAIADVELFWPSFVEHDGCILLAGRFDQANFQNWIAATGGDKKLAIMERIDQFGQAVIASR